MSRSTVQSLHSWIDLIEVLVYVSMHSCVLRRCEELHRKALSDLKEHMLTAEEGKCATSLQPKRLIG